MPIDLDAAGAFAGCMRPNGDELGGGRGGCAAGGGQGGEADAERNAIFATAFGEDPEFFEFYRSLNAYEKSIKGSNSTMVMSPDSEFFNYFKSDFGAK